MGARCVTFALRPVTQNAERIELRGDALVRFELEECDLPPVMIVVRLVGPERVLRWRWACVGIHRKGNGGQPHHGGAARPLAALRAAVDHVEEFKRNSEM